jgi:peptidoglycan/LPS O-acetylase OafA/YrhL
MQMNTMKSSDKGIYFQNLDGLRAIAAFSVIFFHCSFWFTYPQARLYNLIKFAFAFGGKGGDLGVIFFLF